MAVLIWPGIKRIAMKQPVWTDDERYLGRCAELAEIARSRGESPVGSLLVVAGGIVGEGIEAGKIMQDITESGG